MNLIRCDKKHFYDGDKFSACPHCAELSSSANAAMSQSGREKRRSIAEQESVTISIFSKGIQSVEDSDMLREAFAEEVVLPTEIQNENSEEQIKKARTPVVGWFLCIEGEERGESFQIRSGNNFIGRSVDMDIVLQGDSSVSMQRHALVLYEPKKREFIVQVGEARELIYVNDEIVLNPMRIKEHDILTIGNTRLMLFPCCGENFSWDD